MELIRARTSGATRRVVTALAATLACGLLLGSASGDAARDDARLPSSAYPEVEQLLASGRAADALAMMRATGPASNGNSVEHDVMFARAAGAAGRTDDAIAAWDRVSVGEPGLGELARARTVELLVAAGRLDDATARLRSAGGALDADAALVLLVADALREQDALAEAARLYRHVLSAGRDGSAADRARRGLARTLERQGEPQEALDVWRDAWNRFSEPETYLTARARIRELVRALGATAPGPGEAEYASVVRRLTARSRHLEALELAREWRASHPGSTELDAIDFEIVNALYNLRRNAEARAAAEAFEVAHPSSRLVPQTRLVVFRLAVREGQTDRAFALGNALWKTDADGPLTPVRSGAASLLANHLVAVGRTEEGLALYRALYRATKSVADRRTLLLRIGVSAIRAGDPSRAIQNLTTLNALGPQGDAAPAGRFWLGVALLDAGRIDDGIAALADVEALHRFGYYGLRATARLDRLTQRAAIGPRVARARIARATPLTFPSLDMSPAVAAATDIRLATTLARVGLLAEAARLYRRSASTLRGTPPVALLAARASAAAEEHRLAVALVTSHFGPYLTQQANGVPEDLWSLAYPRPYWRDLGAAASAAGVDPTLLLALMRRESRFDASARSSVGALGLFQIMPYTAAALAPELGLEDLAEERLLQPPVNAAIAATLVSRIQPLFSSALTPTIASYNAGEERVSDWWRAGRSLADDLFVELIPYAETRGFVREVFTNYQMYKRKRE